MADTPLSAPRTSSEALGSSGFAPEWALIPEPPGYTVILDKIFIPLATLKAACRNQVSNLFLTMVVNPVSSVMQVADPEVLLHEISDFGDGFVTQDLRVGQLGGGGVLAHDAILGEMVAAFFEYAAATIKASQNDRR